METKTKLETREETAEWLAENVLGWNNDGTYPHPCWYAPKNLMTSEDVEGYLKTPDGFFAVWDAVEKRFKDIEVLRFDFGIYRGPNDCTNPYTSLVGSIHGEGKDRYEAFYNAVYQAMKDGKKGETQC